MFGMSIYMVTTKIEAGKTASEIMHLLGENGAKHIQVHYEKGEVIGIDFIIESNDQKIPFRLPARYVAMLKVMQENKKVPRHLCNEAQAKRVAWRQLLRWLQAQFALIVVGMVDIKEVFMPYILVGENKTFYDELEDKKFKLLERGGE